MRGKNTYYCSDCIKRYKRKQAVRMRLVCGCGKELKSNYKLKVMQILACIKTKRGLRKPRRRAGIRSEYHKYLAGPLWAIIRQRVLARDSFLCQACGISAEVVHHKSYDQDVLDGLRDSELISLCHNCHSAIEFTTVDGKQVKNGLRKANNKLFNLLIVRRSKAPAYLGRANSRKPDDGSNGSINALSLGATVSKNSTCAAAFETWGVMQ